jgi:hypothetical protein
MPRIWFEGITGRPILELLPSDYFYSAQDPNVPLPDPPASLMDRVGRITGPISRLARDARIVPNQLDVNGCGVGDVMVRNANNLNRINQGNYTLYDICLVLMDDPSDGFISVYNRIVGSYARVLRIDAPLIFPENESDRRAFIHEQYGSMQGQVMGAVRAYHAALQCAYARFLNAEHLESGSRDPIIREGMVPGDFR